MSACVQLFSLASLQPAEESKEQSAEDAALLVEINQEALQVLEEQFKGCQRLVPVVVIGSSGCGKSFLLDKIVGLAHETPFQAFGEFKGAIAYPVPVQIGISELLFIEMSGIDFDAEDQESLLTMEVLRALLSVASVCIICPEKTSKTFANITKIMQIYEDMHQHSGLSISKFFVCVESERALSANPLKNGYRDFSRGHFMGICEFFYRGNPGFDENEYRRMIGMISQEHFHSEFQTTHEEYRRILQTISIPSPPTMIEALNAKLHILGKATTNHFPLEKGMGEAGDLTHNFALQVEKPPDKEVANCVQLLSLPIESDEKRASDAELKVTLDEEKLAQLKERFNGCERVIPVLVIGNSGCGKSIILDKIVGQSGNHSVASFKGRFSGVLTCPEPVEMGSYQLLLMEMSGLDFAAQDEEGVLKKKTLHALLSVTSVCIICLEKSSMFVSINEIMKIYEGMQSKSKLQLSKFFICVESEESLSTVSGYTAFRRENYMNICEFVYRGNPGFEENEFQRMIRKISLESFHSQFEDSHRLCQAAFKETSMISTLAVILKELCQLANDDYTLQSHLKIAPDFGTSGCVEETKNILKRRELIARIHHAESIPFFTQTESLAEIHPDTLMKIQSNYKEVESVVVLTVLGNQGMGKSTFLNSIIQYIVETRKRRDIFITGNTTTHTTRGCNVLSYPLPLPNSSNQLMLIDLEGLEGMEVAKKHQQLRQEILIKSVLTITSVYCILIRNAKDNIPFIESYLRRIISLRDSYGFTVDRILLLFHDKDVSSVAINEDLERYIAGWNRDHFMKEEVIQVMNKPSFTDAEKAKMKATFLSEFLSRIDYPKKHKNDEFVNIVKLISFLAWIASSDELSCPDISAAEKRDAETLIEKYKVQIATKFDEAQCVNQEDALVEDFRNRTNAILIDAMGELGDNRTPKSQYVLSSLKTEAAFKRAILSKIQNFYLTIKNISDPDMELHLNASLQFAYQDNLCFWNFGEMSSELKKLFMSVKMRYPPEASHMINIINKLEALRTSIFFRYARMPVEYVLNAFSSIFQIGHNTACFAEQGKSFPFYSEKGICSLPPQIEGSHSQSGTLLLVIGKKGLGIGTFLNEFMKWVCPLNLNCHQAFNDSTTIQTLKLHRVKEQDSMTENRKPGDEVIFCFGFIVCIQLDEQITAEEGRRLSMVAAIFMSKARLTYIFLASENESNDYISHILRAYQPNCHRTIKAIVSPGARYEHLVEICTEKDISLRPCELRVSAIDTAWADHFSHLIPELFSDTMLTIAELADLINQAKDFYLDRSAIALYHEGSQKSIDITLHQPLIKTLEDSYYQKEMVIFLVVGMKIVGIHRFLNDFMKSTFPLGIDNVSAFDDKGRFQAHYFPLLGDQMPARQGLIVYIRMKRKIATPKARKLARMAAMFLEKSALSCFFLSVREEVNSYLNSILETYQSRRQDDRKVWIIGPDLDAVAATVHDMFNAKCRSAIEMINILEKKKGVWIERFQTIKNRLLDNRPLAPQEIKDILVQARKFYNAEPALTLYEKAQLSYPLFLDSTFANFKQKPNEEIGIFLCIGRKKMNILEFADRFINSAYSIANPPELSPFKIFNDNTRFQAATVLLPRKNPDEKIRQIILIYLRMKSKTDNSKARNLAILAATLLSKSVFTCFFLYSAQETSSYLDKILQLYRPQEKEITEAWLVVSSSPRDALGWTEQFRFKFIDLKIKLMNPYQDGDSWQRHFTAIETNLGNGKPISPQEAKDVILQAQRFYFEATAVTLMSGSFLIKKEAAYLIDNLPQEPNNAFLLVVGRKNMNVSHFLNSFMQWNYSLSGWRCNGFTNSPRVQAGSIFIREIKNPSVFRQVVIIYVRIKRKIERIKTKRLVALAATLMKTPALACFFLDSETETVVSSIVNAYEHVRNEQNAALIITRPGGNVAVSRVQEQLRFKQVTAFDFQLLDDTVCYPLFSKLTTELLKLKSLTAKEIVSELEAAGNSANEA